MVVSIFSLIVRNQEVCVCVSVCICPYTECFCSVYESCVMIDSQAAPIEPRRL